MTSPRAHHRPVGVGSALRLLGLVEMAIASLAFVVVCGVVSVNALLRYGFNSSIVWSEEVALLATNVFVFLGAAVILKANADVAVRFLIEKAPVRVRALGVLATYAAASVFFATLLFQSVALWPLQRSTMTFILDISRYWFTLPLVWAAGSMLLTSLAFAVRAAADILENRDRPGPLHYLALPVEPE